MSSGSELQLQRALTGIFLLCVVGLGGGCSKWAAPTLRVTGASVTDESDEGFVISFTLEGENSNDEPLPLHAVQYRVLLDGKTVFNGVRSAEVTLPRYGTQTLQLPASISHEDYAGSPDELVQSGVRFQVSGVLVYITPGNLSDLLFDVGIRRPKVAFVERGTFRDANAPPSEGAGG